MKKDKALALVDPLVLKGICHRGLHNDIYPENSLGAFNNAIILSLITSNCCFDSDSVLSPSRELAKAPFTESVSAL